MTQTAFRLTRRRFLQRLERVAGPDAVYHAMVALELQAPSTFQPLKLRANGAGKTVLVLGAGVGGMAAAYELGKLGYDCRILEPRRRPGGRCWTVRRGTEEVDVFGERQACEFDDGLYYNPGPSRIPYHHRGILSYCKEFGVPLEVLINFNYAALLYNERVGPLSNTRVVQRHAIADLQGYTAELLAKAVQQRTLDDELSGEDEARLLEYLRHFGNLEPDLVYRGAPARGYEVWPGAGAQPGAVGEPLPFSPLLRSEFWKFFQFPWGYDQQMTMLHPDGGIDRIAYAFAERLPGRLQYGAEVRAIQRTPRGVRVLYRDLDSGQTRAAEAEYCIVNIPLTALAYIPGDYPPGMKQAIDNVSYTTGVRFGLQFSRRFWEEDDTIYGGISWTNQTIQQIIYDSDNLLTQKGVLLGAYPFGTKAFELSALSHPERIERLLAEGSKLHPQYREFYETGFTVAWNGIRYSLGCFASYSDLAREAAYPLLRQTDGHIFLVGEHMSYLTGWLEGAVLSAHESVKQLHQRAQPA